MGSRLFRGFFVSVKFNGFDPVLIHENNEKMFGFTLDNKTEEIIAYIDEVKNIEGSGGIMCRSIRLINIDRVSNLIWAIENSAKTSENNGFICFLDDEKSIVTRTFIGKIKIIKVKKNTVTLTGQVWCHPKGFHKAWKMKLNNEIAKKNTWKTFEKSELQGWLVYALSISRINEIKKDIRLQIDGNEFHNLDSFFCMLGEEIHGPAGYFGRSIYAMYDCLRGDFGVESISELTWHNHQKSKKLFKTKFDEIIQIFEEYNIKVILN